MVYLKSIELTNFKSFVGNVKIPFSKNFTVITGPNGSGKSNILDAIRWVLGEQKTKILRAEKSEEVIFGGNKFYSPSSFAKVELCIDVADIEYFITRKIYREEDSEYYINNKSARLKDVQLFLGNLGLGKFSFVFIGQGEIEELILKEDGRIRELIENIAGISGYHERVKDISLKLEVIQSKWQELEEKRKELLQVLEGLRSEVKVADRYEELEKKLKEVQESIRFLNWKKLKDSLDRYLKEKEDIEKRLLEIKTQVIPNQSLKLEVQANYEKIEQEIDRIKSLTEEIDSEIFKLKLNEGILIEKKKMLSDKLDSLIKEKNFLKDRISDVEVKRESILKVIRDYDWENFINKEDELRNKEKRLRDLIIEKTKIEDKLKVFDSILRENLNGERLEQELTKKSKYVEKYSQKLSILNGYKERIDIELIDKSKILRKKEDVYEHNKVEIMKLNNILGELKEGIVESYPRGTREIINNKKNKIHNILKNLIEIPLEYMEALYNLLGNSIYDVVVDDENVAKELINYLKDKKLGWVTFRPLNFCRDEKIKDLPDEIKGLAIRAIDVVKYDPKYERLVRNVLGNVIIFDDYLTASRYKDLIFEGWRIVTLKGEVFHPSGTISGGVRFGVEATLNTERAIIETETKIRDLIEANRFLSQDIEELRIELEKYRTLKRKIENLIIKMKNKISEKEKEISVLQDKIRLYKEYEKEGLVLVNKHKELVEKIEEEEKEINELRKDYEEKKIKKIELEKDLYSLNESLENLKARLSILENEEDKINEEIKVVSHSLERCIEEYKNKEKEKDVLIKENRELLEKGEKLKQEIKKLEREWQKLREEEIILDQRKKDLISRIEEVQIELHENFEENLNLKIDLSEEELKKLENEIKKEMDSLGPINFLAKSKLAEEEAKYNTLVLQMEDISGSINSLKKIIRDTKEEAERKFMNTFGGFKTKANNNWKLFFPNAELDLILENEEDILNSEIKLRIYSQKKNWRNLLMLSGGEKSLVGISLLLSAVELASVNFCFWDEIDAALDNRNAQVLGKKIKDLSEKNQFIIISHNPILIQYADIIYGVTLNEKGSSQVLSWKIKEEVSS